jgi:hypothetical protein
MSKSTFAHGAKVAMVIAVGVMLTASVGSASAAPSPVAAEVVDAAVPTGTRVVSAQPASWRESITTSAAATATTTSRPAQRVSRAMAARQAQAAAYVKFTNFTLKSKATKDMRGVEPSLYRGKYYRAAVEAKRRCIAARESEGHYDVVNPSGAYRGAYQVSAALARGATWMMLKEHKQLMGEKAARSVLAKLRATPMNKWPRYWQDAAFHTVANWNHTGSGIAHWAGGRWHC